MKNRIVIRCESCRAPLIVVDLEEGEILRKQKGWKPMCNDCMDRKPDHDGTVDYLRNLFGMG